MQPRPLAPLVVILALSGCSKSEPQPGAAASAATPATAAAVTGAFKDFEGEIDLLATPARKDKPKVPVAVLIKGAKLRFDLPEELEHGPKLPAKAYVVVSAPEKKVFTVMDAQKQAVVMGLDGLGDQMKQWRPPEERAEQTAPPKVTKTGHMDTVAGYSCEDWEVVNAKGERARVCVANEGTSWFELPSIGLPADSAWARELFDGQHLPLRFVGYDAAGAEDGRLEVTKVEKKPLADTLFEIPPGYRVMDMSEMMRGLMGAMGGMPPGMNPGAMPMPSGMALPPGAQMPPGMHLPPGVQIPPNAQEMIRQMQERARAAGMAVPAPK